jgi:glyoxylase-like metal-dependent hydrolase (beta-lactamase superfamily II)
VRAIRDLGQAGGNRRAAIDRMSGRANTVRVMLIQVAEGVFTHASACMETNGVVVQGLSGVLVVDPGLTRTELACLADDIRSLGQPVVCGFATHPHWDHVLWHPALGDAPRYAAADAVASMAEQLSNPGWQAEEEEGLPPEIAGQVPFELFGQLTALPADARELPWDGPQVRVLPHRAHAPGHAALLVDGVLIAGDMLSDVFVPMPDLYGAENPIDDYLAALDLLEAAGAALVIPGHGRSGHDVADRIRLDRAYIEALRDGGAFDDPRLTAPRPGWEWVSFIHQGNLERAG